MNAYVVILLAAMLRVVRLAKMGVVGVVVDKFRSDIELPWRERMLRLGKRAKMVGRMERSVKKLLSRLNVVMVEKDFVAMVENTVSSLELSDNVFNTGKTGASWPSYDSSLTT